MSATTHDDHGHDAHGHGHYPGFAQRWLFSTNHKDRLLVRYRVERQPAENRVERRGIG